MTKSDLGERFAAGLGLSSSLAATPSVARREHVALVGGGGKTTLLLALGRWAVARGWRVVLTTTTKVGADQMADVSEFVSARQQGDKLIGLGPEEVDRRFLRGDVDLLVVEADGSCHKVVKAHASYEPVIPSTATIVVAVMGADGIDRVIEDIAHRPMRVAAAVGCGPYERLTAERAATLLSSDRGLRKGVPAAARFVVALTRVGPAEEVQAARLVAMLAERGIDVIALPFVAPARPQPLL